MVQTSFFKHLFSFPAAFAGLVGAPSLLSLFEILLERRFLDLLDWIVDGYNRLLSIFDVFADLFILPFVATLNGILGLSLSPGEHWRPLFVLMMIFIAPHIWPVGKKTVRTIWLAFLSVVYFLYASVITSFVPQEPWPWQILIAALPFAFFWIALLEDGFIAMRRRGQRNLLAHNIQGIKIGIGFCLFLGLLAALFAIPVSTRGIAGICSLLTFIIFFVIGGIGGVLTSRTNRVYSDDMERAREEQKNEGVLRDACRTISGLLLAGLILFADWFLTFFR